MKSQSYVVALLAGGLLAGAGGCVRPGPLDSSLVARYQRELADRGPQRRQSTEGLAALEPVTRLPGLHVTKNPKTGALRVELSLDEAVQRHLANSPEIRVVSYDPAISREDAIQAAAAFDFVAFGGWSYTKQDNRPNNTFVSNQTRDRVINAGIRKRTVTGANVEAQWAWSRSWSSSSFQMLRTRHEPTLTFEVTQPLLRDFGPEVNLAQMRVAQLNYQASSARFRQKVEEFVAKVITTYLQLAQARGAVEIEQKLLDVTIETLVRIKKRVDVDATAVQIKQAESAVESRRAGVIRAKKAVLDVQDELVRLIADKDLNLLGSVEVLPSTDVVAVKVTLNGTDQLALALKHSPLLEEARRAIDVADITVKVAKNQTLPRLDLKATGGLQGLARDFHEANRYLGSGDYASYSLGLQLEYPVGNRERRSALRQRRLERLKAISTLQNITDQVAVAVAERIRQVNTTFEEMKAQAAAVEAGKVELQALDDTERIRGQLTPEFLTTKLGAQERLAAASRAELDARTQYNVALVELARVTGTILDQHKVKMESVAGDTGRPVTDTHPPHLPDGRLPKP